jgi:hypothetical protein
VQLYEPDVQIMSKAGFGQMLDFVFAGNTVNMAITSDQVFSHDGGAMVYQFAHFDETFAAKDGKAPAVFLRNNLLARWKRAADGRYVMDRIIVSRMPSSN